MPLPLDEALYGWFKDECEGHTILGFASLAPKFYSLRLKNNESGRQHDIVKLRGFFLRQSRFDTKDVTYELFLEYAQSLLKEQRKSHILGQFNIVTNKKTRNVVSHLSNKIIRNNCFSKRVLPPQIIKAFLDVQKRSQSSNTLSKQSINIASKTLPFGYSRHMHNMFMRDAF